MKDLTKDLGWKLFSLALAFAMWLIVQAVRQDERPPGVMPGASILHTFGQLPILAVSAAADVRQFEVKPVAVSVTVSGHPEVIRAMTSKDLKVSVDLTGIESAQSLRRRVDVSAPPGVALVLIEPDSVDIVIPPKTKN